MTASLMTVRLLRVRVLWMTLLNVGIWLRMTCTFSNELFASHPKKTLDNYKSCSKFILAKLALSLGKLM